MQTIDRLFDSAPFLALFVTIGLGYFVGKFKVRRYVLGGIAGTLLVGFLGPIIVVVINTNPVP